ncbi:choice-of-anchor A family protein [Cellulosimicrobium sp. BIT-GX5]|uniref:Choice-of-anchor A family protein n=1 Tax=Cellulosimicrobium composti TaxID=2672572 RepID=A0A6N7ZF66_9MICO|nr:DUF5979 domain-containing protein [Cellulosimicrobium composti]MTG88097.1 choice-of-anchor A family protein [Cellulosimicrobium composti]
MTRSSSPFTSARPRGPRRLLAAATAAALALSGALVVVAGPSAAPASAVPGQCPAPGEMPGIGNLPPKFTDNNVAVYAGGNYLATGSAAESEGVLLVRGDATFDKDPDGLFNVGTVGVGSQITPDPGALMLAVGGDLTIVGTNTVQVGAGLTPGGAVQVGGALTAPAGQPETEGAPVTTGMGQAAAMSPFADFQDVITETSASLGTATATGTATRDGGRVTFTSTDPSNVTLQAFTIDAADLDGASEFFFAGIPADAPVVINVVGGPVAVSANYVDYNGVRADDLSSAALGEAASRILWNFVDADQVDITGSGQFIGSILAPAASSTITSSTNGRVYVGNDLTTAGSGNEQHNYPWIGPGPFDCIAGSEGGFSVAKLVDGTGAASVPAGTEFTVTWSAQIPDGVVYEGETSGTLTLLADGTVVDGPSDLPEGTVVTLAEPTLPELPGIAWGTPAFDPSAEITIGAGSTTAVTLTNTATLAVGGFSLSKAVQGSGAGAVPGDASFTVAWTAQVPDGVVYDGATTGTVTVLADGTVADGPQDLPVGTVVTFEETVFPEVPGISWGTPVLDPSSVTVGDGTNTLVTVTNAAVQQVGGFSVAKSVEGEASGLVPDDAQFTVEYSYELDGTTVTGSLTVLADGTPVDGPQNLPVGTVVTFTEVQLPEVEGVVWGAPSFSPSSVTVGDGENALVTLTNTATDAPAGGFQVSKALEGTGAASVPADTEFTVGYSYELDGTTVTGSLTVLADGTPVDGPQNLPVGTVVTFTEVDLPTLPGVIWGAPQISPESVTVADDVNAEVVVTNTATLQVGGFQAVKVVEGTGAGRVPAGTEFTVEWTAEVPDEIVYGGETSGTFALLTDGTVAVGPLDLPVGTVVTFAEPEIPEFDGVVWGAPAFDPETVTVADGQVVTVTVTNTATELFGTFSVEKQVAGEAAGLVPDGTEFAVTWTAQLPEGTSYEGPTTGEVVVAAGGGAVDAGVSLPLGTVVTFAETTLPDVDGVVWGTPTFEPASITLTSTSETAEVVVTNDATTAPAGGFSVAKALTGEGASLVPADTAFTVEYAYDLDGTPVTGTLTVLVDGTVVDGPQNLPVGTVVTFTETNLPDVPGVVWGAPVFSPESVTVADGENVLVTLTNTAQDGRTGGFSVAKDVVGGAAASVPGDAQFTVEYSYELEGVPTTGTLVVTADGTVVDGPQNLAVGTVVTFAETVRPTVPGVAWGAAEFSPQSVTVGDGENTLVTLTNTADVAAGGFSVHKVVTGEAKGTVPADTTFTVAYEYTVGDQAVTGTLALRADGTVVDGPQGLPHGTVVTLREVDLPAVAGVDWGTPYFTVDGEKVTTVTVVGGGSVGVTLTNTATSAGGGLATTGASTALFAGLGALLVVGGAALLVVTRRRRSA